MDVTHWILLGVLALVIARARIPLRKDEAIDAATVLDLKELRERFERSK